ncbi:MAG: response regulator [Actinomycetota bacterium]
MDKISDAKPAAFAHNALLHETMAQIQETVASELAAIVLANGEDVFLRVAERPADPPPSIAFLSASGGLVARIAAERRSCWIDTVDDGDADADALRALGIRSILGCPVEWGGRLIAVLLVGWRQVREAAPATAASVTQAGRQVALALQVTRLMEEVQDERAAREAAEAARVQSERRFQAFFDQTPEAVFLLDPCDAAVPMRIVDCNLAATLQNGYSRDELIGRPLSWLDASPAEPGVPQSTEQIRAAGVLRSEGKHRRKDGESVYIERALSLVHLGDEELALAVDHDPTERRRLEEQLRQAQKMEAIGRLTGGVAHDFNNMLSVISGYAELLLLDAAPDSATRERVEEIQRAAHRAADLTRQLLLFSRRERPHLGPVNLNEAVGELTKMVGRLIGEHIALTARFDPDLGIIRADLSQIQQVLVNLVVNARDAMPQGGRLEIETRRMQVDAAVASLCPGMAPGPYALLSVSDTGTGMDAGVRDRIFDPFFTTKSAGKGTGLGLALVYGIVSQCGGHIHVYSEPNQGTVFRLYFPSDGESAGQPTPHPGVEESYAGSETLLLVEDETMLRTMLRLTLEQLGYRVLCPADGHEALRVCLEHPDPIHLLISDLVMPGVNGRVLAERVRAARPETRVLLMSGYTDEMVLRNGGVGEGFAFIEKPFQLNALARKVREVLEQEPTLPRLPQGNGRILGVDDDPSTRETLIELLTEEGYRAEAASDGRKALEQLRAGARPDVILLDLRMPAMNGWVFRIEQRKDPALAQIPVIVLSGAHDPAAAADFLDAPDSLSKPIDVDALLHLIRKHCSR